MLNPVIRKDIIALLRLGRIVAIQVFFIAALAALLLYSWPRGGVLTQAVRQQDNLLLGVVIGQIILLILFVPGIAAVSITSEREQNTLEMIYASRLSPLQIILGKLASAISFPLLLLISGLPFVALIVYRGDVTAASLLSAYLILILTAVLLAVLSLTISVLSKQSSTALVISYLTVLLFCGGVLVPAALMLRHQGGIVGMILHTARSLSPITAAMSLMRASLAPIGGEAETLLEAWKIFIPVSGVVILACIAILVSRLSRPPVTADGFGGGVLARERSIARRILVLIDPNKRRRPFGYLNPVLTKERRTNQLRSGRWMIRIFYASLLLSFALAAMALAGGTMEQDILQDVALVMAMFQIGIIGLVTPSLTSSAISSELETNNFEMLRLAPISGGKIFWGKFLPSLAPALLPIVAMVPAYAALSFIDHKYLLHLSRLIPIAAGAVVFCCTVGLMCSSFTANTARATVASYLITAGVFVPPLFAWWVAGSKLSPGLAAWICLPSPLVMSMAQLPWAAENFTEAFGLLKAHLWLMGGICAVMLVIARIRLAYLLKKG